MENKLLSQCRQCLTFTLTSTFDFQNEESPWRIHSIAQDRTGYNRARSLRPTGYTCLMMMKISVL